MSKKQLLNIYKNLMFTTKHTINIPYYHKVLSVNKKSSSKDILNSIEDLSKIIKCPKSSYIVTRYHTNTNNNTNK